MRDTAQHFMPAGVHAGNAVLRLSRFSSSLFHFVFCLTSHVEVQRLSMQVQSLSSRRPVEQSVACAS